jgi:hypothetical protein
VTDIGTSPHLLVEASTMAILLGKIIKRALHPIQQLLMVQKTTEMAQLPGEFQSLWPSKIDAQLYQSCLHHQNPHHQFQ